MVSGDNLPSKLCALILAEDSTVEATEWHLLGQEQDGSLLFSWIESSDNTIDHTKIGIYKYHSNSLKTLYVFETVQNVIQASVNSSLSLLGFVTKKSNTDENNLSDNEENILIYRVYIINLEYNNVYDFQIDSSKQIMIQFLYRKQSVLVDKRPIEKLLLLIHQECALLYQIDVNKMKNLSFINDSCLINESLVRAFIWAQWDCVHQVLYYIHYRKPIRCLVEGEEYEANESMKLSPTLSGLQFHDDLPHETVLNIPMNLPHLTAAQTTVRITYEDDTVPLRIHDSTLDLQVVSNSEGIVCICHHYLYQPVKYQNTDSLSLADDPQANVNFAYSITLLHHSCVIHCVIPGIPWSEAKKLCPMFMLHEDHHMLIFIPGLFTHLLDIGINHEPCCHIVTSSVVSNVEYVDLRLVPLCCDSNLSINLNTLDVFPITVSTAQLVETFKNQMHLDNKIAIIHYLIVHKSDIETVGELLSSFTEKPLFLGLSQLMKEFLIGSSFASVQRNLPSDACQLVNLLSVTTMLPGRDMELKTNKYCVRLSQDILWNTAMMLLSPQQRIVPYRVDLWTKLWENLMQTAKTKAKFKPSQVADKLMVSLMCYQPEALSRSSTPLSPGGVLGSSVDLSAIAVQNSRKNQMDSLPFNEFESCTASKQEHIISVNLRELSMHLLKHSLGNNTLSRQQWQSQTPIHVHAVATRYVAAQLEQSKYLCQLLCRSVNIDAKHEHEKGFVLIDNLQDDKRYLLFTLLERYYLAVESIAFPLPQGFTSFFTFLGYRTLKFETFLQYVYRNVFEMQVDVMKIIMADTNDTKQGVLQKLKLLSLLPRSRAKRLLNAWGHPVSLMFRAREHALNILSGVEGSQPRARGLQRTRTNQFGLAAFPSADRLSPLDTFLDLLTAKASLAELDFGLLVEATVTSTEEFF
ncbi:pigeon [Carabus blaptoides fortunei]